MSDENVKATEEKSTEDTAKPEVEEKAAEEKVQPAAEEKPVEQVEAKEKKKAKPAAKEKKAKAPEKKEAKADDNKEDKADGDESPEVQEAVEEPKKEVAPPEPAVAPPPAGSQFRATGRRKRSVARVYLTPGSGEITVNKKPIKQYFFRGIWRYMVEQPLDLTRTLNIFDVNVNVRGGGQTGQAGAVKQALSRALCEFNAELRPALKKAGFLTRDARIVERKKYGLAGARKRYQFSKR